MTYIAMLAILARLPMSEEIGVWRDMLAFGRYWDATTSPSTSPKPRPNVSFPMSAEVVDKKTSLLRAHAARQGLVRRRDLQGLVRLRGMKCRAAERYGEAFARSMGQLVV